MLVQGYADFSLDTPDPIIRLGGSIWNAHFRLDTDVSELFPYINAAVQGAIYYEKPHYIAFSLGGFHCSLYGDKVAAGAFEDRDRALEFISDLIDFVNDLFSRRDSLTPDHKKYKHQSVLEIFKLLPRTNCQECGLPTCMAFAVALSRREVVPGQCPALAKPLSETASYPVYDENGKLISTVEIEVNTTQRELDLERQKKRIADLEKTVALIRQANDQGGVISENDGIRVGLTGKELEVLRLLAEGFTNLEIAEILVISHHTVKSHVAHIFNKLGVNDRTQAAVWAAH
jgi:DNA-binding CsgD family transcriptional regulator/ArsR family metal-binding transcriptional regulator